MNCFHNPVYTRELNTLWPDTVHPVIMAAALIMWVWMACAFHLLGRVRRMGALDRSLVTLIALGRLIETIGAKRTLEITNRRANYHVDLERASQLENYTGGTK